MLSSVMIRLLFVTFCHMVLYDLQRSCFFSKNFYLSKRYNREKFSMWKSSQQNELSFKNKVAGTASWNP
jgi:hypothetical protein